MSEPAAALVMFLAAADVVGPLRPVAEDGLRSTELGPYRRGRPRGGAGSRLRTGWRARVDVMALDVGQVKVLVCALFRLVTPPSGPGRAGCSGGYSGPGLRMTSPEDLPPEGKDALIAQLLEQLRRPPS